MCRCVIAAVLPLSIVNMVLGLGLLVAGIVAATYKVPDTCSLSGSGSSYYMEFNDGSYNSGGSSSSYSSGSSSTYISSSPSPLPSSCESDRQAANDLLVAMALMGTVPAVFPLVFGCVGILAALYKNQLAAGLHLACLILGIILSIIGVLTLLVFVSAASGYCTYVNALNSDFCKRYLGSTWAIITLNLILAMYQLAFSILMCALCCQPDQWSGTTSVAVEVVQPGIPIAQVAGTPLQPGEVNQRREVVGVIVESSS
uniref:Uncharacterized protein n=1 Tax=Hanusia phi TaxID=3032 RepID=A0A7S0EMG1_9CRYP|mmetsp:Transcript_26552/g.60579  ORF Transcript_26552/g.60579 Transcript_26552/m.60579 type:complete len:257 (+) Transcript_26552:281-1051(+)